MRDRDTPSVTFGDSSLKEGAKDEGCGFFGLWPQNDRVRTWFFFVWGATTRRAIILRHSERPLFVILSDSEESVTPVFYTTRAQQSGSCCERTSKGAERVFAVRRKQSEADFARTKRSEESASPSLCVTGRERDEGYGFFGLTASE